MYAGLGRPSWPTTRIFEAGEAWVRDVRVSSNEAPNTGTFCGSVPSQRMSLSMVWMMTRAGVGTARAPLGLGPEVDHRGSTHRCVGDVALRFGK